MVAKVQGPSRLARWTTGHCASLRAFQVLLVRSDSLAQTNDEDQDKEN